MKPFGKKKLTESELAYALVLKVSNDVYGNWESIRQGLHQSLNHLATSSPSPDLSEANAPLLITCIVFAEMQALKNALLPDQFLRIRHLVTKRFSPPLEEAHIELLWNDYQKNWDEALERNEAPLTFGIATLLYDLMRLPLADDGSGETFQSPLVLMHITQIILAGAGFSKLAISECEIVPD